VHKYEEDPVINFICYDHMPTGELEVPVSHKSPKNQDGFQIMQLIRNIPLLPGKSEHHDAGTTPEQETTVIKISCGAPLTFNVKALHVAGVDKEALRGLNPSPGVVSSFSFFTFFLIYF